MKGDNKGFSLVELIVAVSILAILIGGAIMAFSTINNAKADKASVQLLSSLKFARSKAMALVNNTYQVADGAIVTDYTQIYVEIYQTSKEDYYVDVCQDTYTVDSYDPLNPLATVYSRSKEVLSSEKLSNGQLEFQIRTHDETCSKLIGGPGSKSVRIYFKKGSGGISAITTESGGVEKQISPKELVTGTIQNRIYDQIYINGASADNKIKIALVKETGRAFLDN